MASAGHRKQGRRPGGSGPRWLGTTAFVLLLATIGFGQDQASTGPATGITISGIEAGFSDGAYNIVRPDAYAPITVQIHNRTGARFAGTLQVISRDRDGETVIHELPGFGVDSGVIEDRQLAFFARNPGMYASSPEVYVRLLDRSGGRLVAAESVPLKYINESDILVLDISPQSIKAVLQAAMPNDNSQHTRGQVQTVYMRPDRLPQFWHELEAVDVIVCDQPDDLGLDEKSTALKVLTRWVQQGGLLVLGPGSLQSFGDSEIGKALPGRPTAARTLSPGKVRLEGLNTSLTIKLDREAGIWQLRPTRDATVLLALPAEGGQVPVLVGAEAGPIVRAASPVVVRRRLGLGAIVQSGISLKTLMAASSEEQNKAGGAGTRIKPEIFGLRSSGTDQPPSTGGGFGPQAGWPSRLGPSELLQGKADFRATGTVLAMLLMLLIVAYGLAATVGTWLVLKRRNLAQFSWLVFAGVAILGSVGAAMLVQSARGIRADVKQQSVIDLDGSSGLAHVRTVYGLKMPYDARVDVGFTAVGRDDLSAEELADSYIRPSSDLEASSGTAFAVRRDYTIPYGRTELSGVPVRATAKQFESYWRGPIRGTVQASLAGAQAGQLADGSWITNGTELDLRDCYLVYATTDSLNVRARDGMVNVVRLGGLAAGKTRSDLANLTNGQVGKSDPLDAVSAQMWWKNLPIEMQGRRSQEYAPPAALTDSASRVLAATMISVLSDVPGQSGSMFARSPTEKLDPFRELPRQGSHWLDLRNVLDGRSALLVGVASTPGPMRLKVNDRAVQPSAGECIVRIVLPFAAGNRGQVAGDSQQ
jgi:hypothetical protein